MQMLRLKQMTGGNIVSQDNISQLQKTKRSKGLYPKKTSIEVCKSKMAAHVTAWSIKCYLCIL